MANVVKVGDHDTDSNTVLPNSNTVFVNGQKIACITDPVSSSGIAITSGSSSVFANSKPVARNGDSDHAGTLIATTPNVFAG